MPASHGADFILRDRPEGLVAAMNSRDDLRELDGIELQIETRGASRRRMRRAGWQSVVRRATQGRHSIRRPDNEHSAF
jgi:hypothetical protein